MPSPRNKLQERIRRVTEAQASSYTRTMYGIIEAVYYANKSATNGIANYSGEAIVEPSVIERLTEDKSAIYARVNVQGSSYVIRFLDTADIVLAYGNDQFFIDQICEIRLGSNGIKSSLITRLVSQNIEPLDMETGSTTFDISGVL